MDQSEGMLVNYAFISFDTVLRLPSWMTV